MTTGETDGGGEEGGVEWRPREREENEKGRRSVMR
jgi:hypothetical protein